MRRRGWVFALFVVLALVAAACQRGETPGGPEAKPTFKMVFMGDLTGPNKSLCIGPSNATEMKIAEANADAAFPVRIDFFPEDTQGDKDKALPIAQKYAADDEVVGVVGPCFSGESFSSNPILQAAQIPQVTPSATNPGLAAQGWTSWFRAVANDDVQSGLTPDVFSKYVKATKVFIGHDKSAYGEGLAKLVNDQSKAAGINVVGFEAADPGLEDYSSIVTKVIGSGADTFYWGAYEKEAGLIVRQLRDRGFKGTFVGADGSKGTNLLSVGGAAAEGVILTCPCLDPNVSDDAAAMKFAADYKAKYGTEPTIYAAEGNDATLLLLEAIRKAGKPGADIKAYRDTVAKNVAASSVKGLTRTLEFEKNGELKGAPGLYLYKVEGGKFKLLGLVSEVAK